ncbi:E3 ubiquitin-protein ligase CCNB1IP1 [Thelohanellus kitauei]|uniref:E3 ubiquitin-protein ligase CCNB1IP1 n=1 Tax=Thelohanellus kitauei TaxID=669202 RepID=A0A0C2INI4_THEKT|nr:E3 ubiquitin-protein ligase CCNB1IP1 [Thelohanellus kitauei]
MEIASRGLAFWSYQMHQEKAFQTFVAQKAKESRLQLENYHNSVTTKMEHEINSITHNYPDLRSEIASKSKEMEETRTKLAEANEKLQERIRQFQKLQNMYDSLKRF